MKDQTRNYFKKLEHDEKKSIRNLKNILEPS
jgi:hypothetical protein